MRSVILSLMLFSAPAFASGPECPCEADRATLSAFSAKLAAAETPEDAQRMALAKIALSHKAIVTAGKVFPNDPDVAAAEARLDAFEDGVVQAQTQDEVALQFDTLMATPVSTSCAFTTTEIVIIVIGFVLGIIPGIIFLFLFC